MATMLLWWLAVGRLWRVLTATSHAIAARVSTSSGERTCPPSMLSEVTRIDVEDLEAMKVAMARFNATRAHLERNATYHPGYRVFECVTCKRASIAACQVARRTCGREECMRLAGEVLDKGTR